MGAMVCKSYAKRAGEPVHHTEPAEQAWTELPELQVRGYHQYVQETCALVQQYDRIELYVYKNGYPAGIAVLIELQDIHYGTCLCVMHMFSTVPEGGAMLLTHVYAYAKRLASMFGIETLVRSKRLSSTRYLTIYRSI